MREIIEIMEIQSIVDYTIRWDFSIGMIQVSKAEEVDRFITWERAVLRNKYYAE